MTPRGKVLLAVFVVCAWLALAGTALALTVTKGVS